MCTHEERYLATYRPMELPAYIVVCVRTVAFVCVPLYIYICVCMHVFLHMHTYMQCTPTDTCTSTWRPF